MIVVSNTSPLTNLGSIGHFDLLRQLYGVIHIADGVWHELNANETQWPGTIETKQASWIERHRVQDHHLITALCKDLDRGEAESIALALALRADLILLDEQQGRYIAERLGLRMTGVIGILLSAKAQGLIAEVRPCLELLRKQAGFYLSDSIYQHALDLAEESDQ